jgi:hypothetical protein
VPPARAARLRRPLGPWNAPSNAVSIQRFIASRQEKSCGFTRGRDRVRVATILARKKLGFTLAGFAS